MLRVSLAAFAFAAILSSCDIADAYRVAMAPKAGEGVEAASLASASTGTTYSIYVSLPDSYASEPGASYPLLFLLDGDMHFAEARARAASQHSSGLMREAIIVGVGYGSGEDMRNRDYTPTNLAGVKTDSGAASGGASAFLAFLSGELLPWVEARYRVSSDRSLRGIMGHSYGGLFALYALFHASDRFALFVASSPTIGWDRLTAFSYPGVWAASGRPTQVSLFASSGAGDSFPTDALIKDMTDRVAAISGTSPVLRYYDNEVHSDVWRKAFAEGMAALLPEAAK
jgi:predicted alpha/beta superfamily hydrolase